MSASPGCHKDFTEFSLRVLVAGERCKVAGKYFERGSTSVNKK